MPKILVVDDEIEILSLVEVFLVRKGFEVITAQDGYKGLQAMGELGQEIDVVVLDHRMPYLDGVGVLEKMKDKGFKKPVILLTGSIGKEVRKLEVDALLLKPVDLEELLEKIKELSGGMK